MSSPNKNTSNIVEDLDLPENPDAAISADDPVARIRALGAGAEARSLFGRDFDSGLAESEYVPLTINKKRFRHFWLKHRLSKQPFNIQKI